jgi:hypothetical protein
MHPHHVRFLVLEQGIGSAVFNFLLNGAIAWLLFRGLEQVPLWGQQSIAGDTIGTCFFLPFLTTLIVTPLARARVRAGNLTALPWTRETHPPLRWLPGGTLKRGLVLGIGTMVLIGPLSVALLGWANVQELSFWPFVWFKAAFAALLALIVTPIISIWAIAETGERVGVVQQR